MDTKTLTDTIRYVALAIILMLAPRPAEAQDSLIKTKKQAELILPRPMLQPMKSMDLSGQVPMDTLSTADSTVKILLFADNTWKYIKDPSRAQNNTVFNESWEHTLPNPYKVSDETLPSEIALWIVDSLGGYRCPNQTKVYSKFGYRHRRRHMGVDLPLNIGTPVYAAFDGRVRIAHRYKAYGNLVIIRHENGLETFYGHLSKIMVEEDEWVSAGSIIGLGGSTGRTFIRTASSFRNPLQGLCLRSGVAYRFRVGHSETQGFRPEEEVSECEQQVCARERAGRDRHRGGGCT